MDKQTTRNIPHTTGLQRQSSVEVLSLRAPYSQSILMHITAMRQQLKNANNIYFAHLFYLRFCSIGPFLHPRRLVPAIRHVGVFILQAVYVCLCLLYAMMTLCVLKMHVEPEEEQIFLLFLLLLFRLLTPKVSSSSSSSSLLLLHFIQSSLNKTDKQMH